MSYIRLREALRRSHDTGCVNSAVACQALNELEKHDPVAVKRILRHAHEHIERHRRERGGDHA